MCANYRLKKANSLLKFCRSLLLFVMVIMLLNSCETVIKMDLPPHTSKLVINGVLSDGDSISVNLTQSLHILDNSEIKIIESAEMLLYVNGTLTDTLKHVEYGNYTSTKLLAAYGNTYTITAKVTGFETASVTTEIPQPVAISNLIVVDSALVTPEDIETVISFMVNDPSTTKNYYRIRVIAISDSNYVDTLGFYYCQTDGFLYINGDDPVYDENNKWGNSFISFTDDLFNGKTKQLPIKLSSENYNCEGIKELHVVFQSLTRDYYLYLKTSEAYQNSNGNPFAEPVPVYTNVQNGFGILGSSSEFWLQVK